MRIKRIRVQNLRAVKDCILTLDGLTALVGPNGAGKSTFLHALALFRGDRTARKDDYYNGDIAHDIRIQVTFDTLNFDGRMFPKYTRNGMVDIARIIRWTGDKAASSLHWCFPGNPDFKAVLGESNARTAFKKYNELVKKPEYSDFPRWTTIDAAKKHLLNWERDNPDKYTLLHEDDEDSGDNALAATLLSVQTHFLYVPAVLDAAGPEGKGPALGELLDATVESAITKKPKLQDPKEHIKAIHDALMNGKGLLELDDLRANADKTLGTFVRGAGLGLEWIPPDPDTGMPRAEPRLVEDGYRSPVDMAGHGLQRAFIMAAALHPPPSPEPANTAPAGKARKSPSLVMAIEEPELYQHPARMRHLASLLRSLPHNGLDGAAGQIQVIYTTHSPHFVFADSIDQIRLVRKEQGDDDRPMTTGVSATTQADILGELKRCGAAGASDRDVDYSLLQAMDPAASEGFFADAVVLVEGPSDRIALMGTAGIMGQPLDALGVSVVSCGSKSAIPLPLVMFRKLGIPVYAVWDADKNEGKQREESERIVAALGYDGGDWRGKITESFACLEAKLEDVLAEDLKNALGPGAGEDPYSGILEKRRALHRLGKFDSKPLKARLVMEEASEKNLRLETLESIVGQIVKLAGDGGPA